MSNSEESADVSHVRLLSKGKSRYAPAGKISLNIVAHVPRVAPTAVHIWDDEKSCYVHVSKASLQEIEFQFFDQLMKLFFGNWPYSHAHSASNSSSRATVGE